MRPTHHTDYLSRALSLSLSWRASRKSLLTRLNQMSMQAAKSKSLPFMPQPETLDGSMAGETQRQRMRLRCLFAESSRQKEWVGTPQVLVESVGSTDGGGCVCSW